MPNTEDRQVLRHLEMIARVRPSRESTQRALDRVRRQLVADSMPKAPTGPRIIQLITSHAAIKAAIAACIVVAVTLTLVFSRPRPTVRPTAVLTPGPIPTRPVVKPEDSQLARDLQTQLQQVETLYSARDVDGLMGLLEEGALKAKVAAAQRLADLRDPRAIETLSRLAAQWTAGPERNPFENAIQRIRGQEEVVTPLAGEVSTASSPGTATGVAGSASGPVLSGLVTDIQTGQPIADVGVQIVGPQVYLARTGTDGSYRLATIEQAGDYRLQVQSPEYLGLEPQDPCGVVVLGPGGRVVRDIRLERGCRVDVEVVDEDGRPIKDVRLSAHWLGSDQDNDAGQPALTSQDGRATVGALRPSDVSYQIAALCDNYALQHTTVTCSDPTRVDPVRVTLHKGVAVPGHAQYADGTPAQGIQIYAIPDWWHANTLPTASAVDGAGNFVLGQIQAGLFNLHVSVPQGDGLAYSFRLAQAQLPTTDGQPLVVTIPQQGLALLSGTIRWPDHRRPEYIDLMAYCVPGTIARTRVQPQVETFALVGLKPGLYTLVFEGPNVEDKIIQGVQAPGSDLEVALQYVPTPRLRGIVLAAGSGQPVERFNVALMKTRSWPGLMYLPETQWHSVSDPNGLFEISTEGPGQYEVQVIAEGFVPAVLDRVDTRKPRQLVVELSRGGRIKGQVVNAAGEPISGAVISPLIGDQVGRSVGNILRVRGQAQVRSVQGEFVLDHVPAGLHGLRVTHPQFSAITLEGIEVLEGRTTEGVRVTLRVGGIVEGTVFDAQGRPQANITLTFHDGSAPYGPGHEDAGLLATVVTDDPGH